MHLATVQRARARTDRVLIVDDQALVRLGLAITVSDLFQKAEIVEATTVEEAVNLARSDCRFDLVLLDPAFWGAEGYQSLRRLGELLTDIPIVVVSASEDPADVRHAFACGAQGYIVKSATSAVRRHALELILSGARYVTSVSYAGYGFLTDELLSTDARQGLNGCLAGTLTRRETDVLALMAQGLSNKEIALDLGLCEGTIKVHARSLFRKLHVSNRTRAVVAGVRAGCIPPFAVAPLD